ncbi:MAG: hypothetical protein R3F18_20460, partial [Lysobacterales bacterium]
MGEGERGIGKRKKENGKWKMENGKRKGGFTSTPASGLREGGIASPGFDPGEAIQTYSFKKHWIASLL